jgi:hypothetical protein
MSESETRSSHDSRDPVTVTCNNISTAAHLRSSCQQDVRGVMIKSAVASFVHCAARKHECDHVLLNVCYQLQVLKCMVEVQ